MIGIGINPGKAPMFTDAERVAMLEDEVKPIAAETGTRISVVTFSGLAVDAARTHKASVIVRGLRDGTDFDYEMQMSGMNGEMAPDDSNRVMCRRRPPCAISRPISCAPLRAWVAMRRRLYRRPF